MEYCSLSVLAFFVLLVAIPAYWRLQWYPEGNNPASSTIITWKDKSRMTNKLSTINRPLVLKETPFDDLISTHSLDSIMNTSSLLVTCKISANPVFQYHAVDQPLAEYTNLKKSYTENIMMIRDVMERVYNNSGNMYFYSAGSIEMLNITLKPSIVDRLTFPNDLHPPQVNYWLGGGGVTAYNHYDTSHNLHYLYKGRKRFILTPPNYHDQLKLYSCLHPLYRQTQIDPSANDHDHSSPSITIDLLPQQTLYLPPYWFHTVITLEPSISLNVWSNSRDYLLMEDILKSPIPFESDWSTQTLLKAAKAYVDAVIQKLFNTVPSEFVNNIVLPRYDSIHLSPDVHSTQSPLPSECGLDVSDDVISNIEERVEAIRLLFMEMSSESVREINLGNYIEHILYTLLQREEEALVYIPVYLKQCW